jgi:hypothetical protein
MSAAIASAKRRRAPIAEPVRPSPGQSPETLSQQQQSGGLTLQQVITILNSRVLALEDFVKTEKTKEFPNTGNPLTTSDVVSNTNNLPNDIIDEFNERFMILAQEISNLKDMLLSLQTYTMSVNKTLMEERINILSEINMTNEPLHLDNSEDTSEQSTTKESSE